MDNQQITNPSDTSSTNTIPVNQSTIPPDTKTNLIMPILLAVLISSIVFSTGGYVVGSRAHQIQKNLTVSSPTPVVINEKNELPTQHLPFPVVRTKTKINYADWTLYKDKSGYSFYYPKNWFVSEGGNQVQSWDPNNSNSRPGPLGDDETKWDLYFGERSFSSFEEALGQIDSSINKWDILEVSSTTKGWPVYFTFKEVTAPMGNPYLVAVIMTPENKTITLHGFSGGAKSPNIEVLKQIVESINK